MKPCGALTMGLIPLEDTRELALLHLYLTLCKDKGKADIYKIKRKFPPENNHGKSLILDF